MTAAPPIPPGDRVAERGAHRWSRLLLPGAVLGTLGAATVALYLRDPHEQGSWGACPTKAFVGIECPGCGGLRAVNDLTHFQVLDAASSNLLFVASIPFLAYIFGRWVWGRWSGRSWSPSDRSMNISVAVLLVGLFAFTVLRNTPVGSWLAP
ncbi:DUF2752 domain-containing protein [Nocardioides stalactiti]|uniref:DUF2752 domain-containing protein n=1 Tax=Nocardioides stalactiti TaxID=2755356 RepID=UPI0016048549|nr:DUF2752 domain-containing protein [Nocardioides stalactiti]